MNRRPLIINILTIIALFIVGSFFLSIFVSIISGLLWFAIKLLIPIAIVVWLVRVITKSSTKRKYY